MDTSVWSVDALSSNILCTCLFTHFVARGSKTPKQLSLTPSPATSRQTFSVHSNKGVRTCGNTSGHGGSPVVHELVVPRVSWLALHNVWFGSLIGQGNGRDLRIRIKIYGKLALILDSAGMRPWGWGGDEQSCPLLIMMWKITPWGTQGGAEGKRGVAH